MITLAIYIPPNDRQVALIARDKDSEEWHFFMDQCLAHIVKAFEERREGRRG